MWKCEQLRMAPLAWVEGKPVYKGDRLWWVTQKRWINALRYENNLNKPAIKDDNDCVSDVAWLSNLTWTPPKVKREGWVNVYGYDRIATTHESQEKANLNAGRDRIACVRIEWEE